MVIIQTTHSSMVSFLPIHPSPLSILMVTETSGGAFGVDLVARVVEHECEENKLQIETRASASSYQETMKLLHFSTALFGHTSTPCTCSTSPNQSDATVTVTCRFGASSFPQQADGSVPKPCKCASVQHVSHLSRHGCLGDQQRLVCISAYYACGRHRSCDVMLPTRL